jgi:hypothetical protein
LGRRNKQPDARRGPIAWLADHITNLLAGTTGILLLVGVGIFGQVIWAFYASEQLDLADTIALEGVIVAVVFGVPALRTAVEHESALEGVSGTLSDVSLGLSGVSGGLTGVAGDLQGVSQDVTTVSKSLEDVANSVLTRTLGEFPGFFQNVPDLIGRAKRSVMVMCDNPAYAVVSNGPAFASYLERLKTCITRGREVQLMFLDAPEREELHLDQVGRGAPAEKWEAGRASDAERRADFLRRADRLCDPRTRRTTGYEEEAAGLSIDGYVKRLHDVNQAVLCRHMAGAERKLMKFRDSGGSPMARTNGPSIYFWMRDDQEAIFVVVPLAAAREVAFSTVDKNLIAALKGVYGRYEETARPLGDEECAET